MLLNQVILCGDLAQPWFLVSSLCGESLILFHCAGVKLWFGDVSAHPCSVALRSCGSEDEDGQPSKYPQEAIATCNQE